MPLVSVAALDDSAKVVLVDSYGDGTIWSSIEDEAGRRATISCDGREDRSTRFRLFDGGRHPSNSQLRLLELGALEEGIAVTLLSRWLEEQRPQTAVEENYIQRIRERLLLLGDGQ